MYYYATVGPGSYLQYSTLYALLRQSYAMRVAHAQSVFRGIIVKYTKKKPHLQHNVCLPSWYPGYNRTVKKGKALSPTL
jgi:hypothetical protein